MFDWIKEPTLLAALLASLTILVALVRFLFYIYKKTEETKQSVNKAMLDLANEQTDLVIQHSKQLLEVVEKVNITIKSMDATIQSSIAMNKSVKESTDQNIQATRELKDFLTNTVVRVLQQP
jgi:predicted PurR-regulated permease PerM